MDITFYLFFIALLVSFAAWCIFLWGIRTGQFHEVEDIKYQVWPKSSEPGEPGSGVLERVPGELPPEAGAR
jgi:cbb3-type cytochrome oxidase maturation protein